MIKCPICNTQYEEKIFFCENEDCSWEFKSLSLDESEEIKVKEAQRIEVERKKYLKLKKLEKLISTDDKKIDYFYKILTKKTDEIDDLSQKLNNYELTLKQDIYNKNAEIEKIKTELDEKNNSVGNISPHILKLFEESLESSKTKLHEGEVNNIIPNLEIDQFDTIEEHDQKIKKLGIIEAGKIKLKNYVIKEEMYYFDVEFLDWIKEIPNNIANKVHINRDIGKMLYNKDVNHILYVSLNSKEGEIEVENYFLYLGDNKFIECEKLNINTTITNSKMQQLGLVLVKKGFFMMGDNELEKTKPIHKVEINYDFYVAKYQVTQKLWKNLMGNNNDPSYFKGDNLPMEEISWFDSIKFCNELSKKELLPLAYNNNGDLLDHIGNITNDITKVKGIRLLTATEWEYTAKGGHFANIDNTFIYSGSNDIDKVAWHSGNSLNKTHNVGTKNPNELGIYDMTGNVWEWCLDSWEEKHINNNSNNINIINLKESSYKVIRGGSWGNNAYGNRVSFNGSSILYNHSNSIGFRFGKTF